MDDLATSTVHRNLEAKPKILGFELTDLLIVLLVCAVTNLFFGKTALGLGAVFSVPPLLATVLFVAKRGRPDGFLAHFVRYHAKPGAFAAGGGGRYGEKRRGRINGV